MKEELLKLAKEQEEYDNNHYIGFYDSDYRRFADLYEAKIHNSLLKKKNIQEFMDNLDIVMKYTCMTSSNWLSYKEIISRDDFLDALADNLKHFKFLDEMNEPFEILTFYKDDVFTNKILNSLCDLKLESDTYDKLFKQMKAKERKLFLEKLVSKKVPIDYYRINLSDEETEFLKNNVLDFASSTNNLLSLRKLVKYDKECLNKLNNYIDNNSLQLAKSIVIESFPDKDKIDVDELGELVNLIIKDIVDSEKCNVSDIKFITRGGYSTVFQINDEILKIGKNRGTEKFNNNPYVIAPLLRKRMKTESFDIFMEVTERCDTDTSKITYDDLYELYKNLRDIGLVWTDIRITNVGILLKDNVIHWKDEISPSDRVLNLGEKRGKDIVLKAGSLVILDADYIFDENSSVILETTNGSEFRYEFEKRYRFEKENRSMKR